MGVGYNTIKGNPDLHTDPGLLPSRVLQVKEAWLSGTTNKSFS